MPVFKINLRRYVLIKIYLCKQFDDGDNFLNFEEFQNLIIFDEGEEFVTDNDIQDFLNKFDGSKDGLISKAESNPI